jgi:glycosyltransferase involved in cell wall biosynthesis
MSEENLIVGFLKVRNEIIREGNIYRCLHNMQEFCDDIFVACDASWDGTDEYIRKFIPEDHIIQVKSNEQDFAKELSVKQDLLNLIHSFGPWKFIWWSDADEVLDKDGTNNLREFCRQNLNTKWKAWAFHYQQLWLESRWARIDDQFDDGWFVKLWRYTPELSFDIVPGTHNAQFPHQFHAAFNSGLVERAPYEVLHYGNYGANLKWKCIQYSNGLGGVERHMNFENASYREIPIDKFPPNAEHNLEVELKPIPYTQEFKDKLIKLNNLKNLKDTFCVTISTYNRANTLSRAIDSVLNQSFQNFIIVVIDDGSLDNTKELMRNYEKIDPRIFYIQCLEHKGGVAVNEIACDVASNTCEFWTRLGSDDWFALNKLELDYEAFKKGHKAIFGTFQAHDQVSGQLQEFGNSPYPLDRQKQAFEAGGFIAGWADFAVHTDILKQIKKKYNMYVHPNLINMEDCLLNYRICKESPWMWRGIYNNELCIPDKLEEMSEITKDIQAGKIIPTAFWNKDPKGSSANFEVYAKDRDLTTKLIISEKEV